jgi:hypothetical protein
MPDNTYNTKIYKDYGGDRIVYANGGMEIFNIREAGACGSCGDLPPSGHVVLGNSSAAIICYYLPVPETSIVGSVLHVHAPRFDDVINMSTHWYVVAGSSGGNYTIGSSSAAISIVYDSTQEVPINFDIQCRSTNGYRTWLPPTTGALITGLVFSTSGPNT